MLITQKKEHVTSHDDLSLHKKSTKQHSLITTQHSDIYVLFYFQYLAFFLHTIRCTLSSACVHAS